MRIDYNPIEASLNMLGMQNDNGSWEYVGTPDLLFSFPDTWSDKRLMLLVCCHLYVLPLKQQFVEDFSTIMYLKATLEYTS